MAEKNYIGSQQHWEDSVNADYDERERQRKEQEPKDDRVEEIPAPPVKDMEAEVKALLEKFTVKQRTLGGDMINHTVAKQCTIKHCELMIEKLSEMLNTGLHNDFALMDEILQYTNLINQIKNDNG